MLKKALLAGVLGVFLTSGMAMASSKCSGDTCNVDKPTKVEFGLDLKIDVDVCVDAGNLFGDYWSTQALIYQKGDSNNAIIGQKDANNVAGIVQIGNTNYGYISQDGSDYALIYQEGNANAGVISQTQGATFTSAAVVFQLGNSNYASITQQ